MKGNVILNPVDETQNYFVKFIVGSLILQKSYTIVEMIEFQGIVNCSFRV